MHTVLRDHEEHILGFDADAAQVWGRLRVPHPEHELDKQIAATALVHDLTVVTRNVQHFHASGVKLSDPFSKEGQCPTPGMLSCKPLHREMI